MDPVFESAVARGDAAAVRDLLERGADPDARDRHGQTALMRAALAGHEGVVEALLAHGAALDTTAKHRLSALMLACLNDRVAVARRLAAAGADLGLRGSGAPGFAARTAADLARARGLDRLAAELERLSTRR